MSFLRQCLAENVSRSASLDRRWEIRSVLTKAAQSVSGLVNLGHGEPDLAPPPNVLELAGSLARKGRLPYTEPWGLKELRERVAARLESTVGIKYDPNTEVVITSGSQEAMSVALRTLINPGDEVVLADPFYPAHVTAIQFAHGVPVFVDAIGGPGRRFTASRIEKVLSRRTRGVVVVSPANPSGVVLTAEELRDIAALARRHNLWVISDEIYDSMVWVDRPHLSIASLEGMRDRTFVINGFSKTYCMTGWRVGYLAGPADVMDQVARLRHSQSVCAPTLSQLAAIEALSESSAPYVKKVISTFRERRDAFVEAVEEVGLPHNGAEGTFYVLVDVASANRSAEVVAQELVEVGRVLAWPVSMFSTQPRTHIRFSLTAPVETLRRAVDALAGVVFRGQADVG